MTENEFIKECEGEEEIPKEIMEKAQKRWEAKKNKDWATADTLRKEIKDSGFEIEDLVNEYKIKRV